jgi:hypothetical protein
MNYAYGYKKTKFVRFCSEVNHWRRWLNLSNWARQVFALLDRRHNNNKFKNANTRNMEKSWEVRLE